MENEMISKRFDRDEKMLANIDRVVRKLEHKVKQLGIQVSQITYNFNQANEIVKHLVLQNYILQKRTGGIIDDKELKDGQDELRAKFEARKNIVKPGNIQPS
jgi:regulator of replication initiation timing